MQTSLINDYKFWAIIDVETTGMSPRHDDAHRALADGEVVLEARKRPHYL